tara:strand:- start:319 stop:666 length:348 start_codon:yes stop_codon:yes gene_type:complete
MNRTLPSEAVVECHRSDSGNASYSIIFTGSPDNYEEPPKHQRLLAIVPSEAVHDEDGWLLGIGNHIPEIVVVDKQLRVWRDYDNFSYEVMEILHAYNGYPEPWKQRLEQWRGALD